MTDKVMITLADLGTLAFTADRNGTQSAFVSVAMQWAIEAQKEIERLSGDVKALELAEEGAKTAFAHVVDQKHEIERECMKLRENLSATHRALTLELQQHKRSHEEVLRLAERLRKYEPGKPMHLA